MSGLPSGQLADLHNRLRTTVDWRPNVQGKTMVPVSPTVVSWSMGNFSPNALFSKKCKCNSMTKCLDPCVYVLRGMFCECGMNTCVCGNGC